MQHIKEIVKLLEHSQHYYTIAIGMDSVYFYVSPNYDRNFRLLNDTLLGKPFHITLHPDDVKMCGDTGAKCFETPYKLQTAILRKHDGYGGFISTQWEFKALFDDNNAPAGVFCIGHNITKYVDTQKQLLSAETEIVQKNDQLDQISFMQSHVIRKPLANILGLVQVLDGMDVEPELHNIKMMIIDSSTELDNVVRGIIEKAKSI
ncbi:hypothetical protein BDD43_5493 [Mucilaginibacter gracilis]|uniref:histidine kinase n=1 Tax=Mucilaginibacter gracilis TaxID=423350 RepID=A0A495JAZ2_9SPHI|nr:hypothetical protein [Mucilaginibacter gracilis]RKR85229.1 hypothetical protein BDD43_5493 [Mucilaginibacter gracilis]